MNAGQLNIELLNILKNGFRHFKRYFILTFCQTNDRICIMINYVGFLNTSSYKQRL